MDAATACHAAAVSKVYGTREAAVHALRDVTLDIRRGAFTAIMGPSGSGKSTLLHCLAALDTPTSGRVFLGGTELTALSRRQQAQVRRDRIGFVFQSFNLVPTLDALENITLPQLLAGRRPDRAWLQHVIARVGLGDRLHHRPSELSGGQQQRIALARALAGRPEVIFADEPTGNLDTTASCEMLMLLRDAVDQFNQTVVTVTHDPSIASYADQILYFSDGRVVDRTGGPDADHAFDRPRQLAGGDGRDDHGLPARRRADGQQTMRSRRRRQPEGPAPGRPMVGSDDEVEVARQERWLERIREQFEAEHAARDQPDAWAAAADSRSTPDDTIQQPTQWTDHQAHWTDHETPLDASGPYDDERHRATGHASGPLHDAAGDSHDDHHRHQATGDAYDDHRRDGAGDDLHDRHHAAPDVLHADAHQWQQDHHQDDPARALAPFHHDAAGADGWLPPERAQLHTAPDTGAREDPGVDTGMDRWREDTVTRSEIAPWSRPTTEPSDEHELTQPTELSGWRVTGDPWAPTDEHLAEEYHSERSTGRRGRSRQHDSGDTWSTDRWEAHAEDTVGPERVEGEPQDANRHGEPAHQGTDERLAGPSPRPPEEVAPPARQMDDARYAHWRHDDHAGGGPRAATNGWNRNGSHTDEGRTAVNGHDRDPWTNVWDAHAGPDIGEVWTPTFDRSRAVDGNGDPAPDLQPVEPSSGRDADQPGHDSLQAVDTPWSPPVDKVAPTHSQLDQTPEEHDRRADDRDRSEIDTHDSGTAVGGAGPVEAAPVQDEQPDLPVPDDHQEVGAPVELRDDDVPRDLVEHLDDGQPPTQPEADDAVQQADTAASRDVQPVTDHDVRDPGRRRQTVPDRTPVAEDAVDDAHAAPASGAEVPLAPPASEPAPADAPTTRHQPDAPTTQQQPDAPTTRHQPDAPVTPTRPEPPTAPPPAASARRSDATVPPPLASLRNTRRPGEPRDPIEALQSLQEQLDRLGGIGRRGHGRPRRAGSGDTDRSER